MPQIFDFIANESAFYKCNELEYFKFVWTFGVNSKDYRDTKMKSAPIISSVRIIVQEINNCEKKLQEEISCMWLNDLQA